MEHPKNTTQQLTQQLTQELTQELTHNNVNSFNLNIVIICLNR